MEKHPQNPKFLKERFPGLAKSPEVEDAANRIAHRVDEVVSKDSEARIQNYLDRFKEIIGREDPKEKARGINALKKILIDKYAVRVEDLPESYWQAQLRVVRNRGEAGDWQDLSEEEVLKIKQEHLAQTKEDQKGSLEEWIDYLTSDKSSHLPDYFKYWAFQGMLQLERYEKGNKEQGIPGRFPKRPSGQQRSIKMFPEVNERGLEFIATAYQAQSTNQPVAFRYDIPPSNRSEFLNNLQKKDFRSLYGWTQENLPPISPEEMQTTEGQWVSYPQGSDPKTLTTTLQGKGSGWCIAGENLAGEYLTASNLYVYYTIDREGNPTIPRVVIVQKNNRVTEVRGIEWEENVDDYIKKENIIGDKLKEVSGGEDFAETNQDTKRLTAIDRKVSANQSLTSDELTFLYGIEKPIKYFGYKQDPRIAELRADRNSEEDMLIIFKCTKEQIAHVPSQINENTKAYVGQLEPGIFQKLPENLNHVYTSFPEKKIRRENIEIGGKTAKQLISELEQAGINISNYAKSMLKSREFVSGKNSEEVTLVRLTVTDLGFKTSATTDQIYERAQALGLELCPADTGLHYRLKYQNQPLNEWVYMGMKPITGSDGYPGVFGLGRRGDGLWLSDGWAQATGQWNLDDEFVFRLRKSES